MMKKKKEEKQTMQDDEWNRLSNSDECEKEEHSDHNSLVNHFQTKSSE
jgi:hypothetical protein